jgi:capsid assembly protease
MTSALLARLAGRPMAFVPHALDGLLVHAPKAHEPMLQLRNGDRDAAYHALTEDGIAVVPILGPLLTRGDWLTALLGARGQVSKRRQPRGHASSGMSMS